MNWEAIGAISETLATLAVVISLIYLAIQIKIQNQESRVQSVHQINETFREVVSLMVPPQEAGLMLAASKNFEALSDVDQYRFTMLYLCVLKNIEEAEYHYRHKRLDSEIWSGLKNQMTDFHSFKASKIVWNKRKHHFSEPFQTFVEQLPDGNDKVFEMININENTK